jgi:hypothetical protein
MNEPKSLDSLFKEKLFRIPDYQRGYAWQREQLDAFWEDLVNLHPTRAHYTGVLTLKQVNSSEISPDSKEYWLVDDHSYKLYHIVDGQQRLTTFVIFLQSFVDLVRDLPENLGRRDSEIFVSDTLTVASVQEKFLYMLKPPEEQFRTYKFGYMTDNPSYDYMRYRILGEDGGGTLLETFYTLNLSNAKRFFYEQLRAWHKEEGTVGIQNLYRTLTKRFLFNEYIIKDEFDVFVAFETMNNRGKKLSDLELLKNRLIYLTTLYSDDELDAAERYDLRELINNAWKEVYYQLGRNKTKPLNDDEFLKAHWAMYFKYSRKTDRVYVRFLLDEQFTPLNVHKKVVENVELEEAELQTDVELDEEGDEDLSVDDAPPASNAKLKPTEIRDYVNSLRKTAVHWFRSWYPDLVEDMGEEEREWIRKLNRLGISYFRPLVTAILKNISDPGERVNLFKAIERYIFVMFRLSQFRTNYGSSEFSNAARGVESGEINAQQLLDMLRDSMANVFAENGTYLSGDFYNHLEKKFKKGVGYYGWSGLRYFLYEYELHLLSSSRQKKLDWSDLLKTPKDKISIEHIYPQSDPMNWKPEFKYFHKKSRRYFQNTLGNLIVLSMSINSSLQDDSFEEKKTEKIGRNGGKLRAGYSDGSHSEIEVSKCDKWGPSEIIDRGLRLLEFMERRWNIKFEDNETKEAILFVDFEFEDVQSDD